MEKTKRKLCVWAFAGIAAVTAFFTFAISAQAQTQECAHSVQEYTVVKEATCTEVGYYGWVCNDCGEVQSYDVEIEKTAHSYDSKAYTTKATTKKDGVVTYTCSVCGKTKTKSYAKIGSITLSKTAYTYNGKAKAPKITVKDADGNTISSKYYTVTYISRSTGKTVSSMKSVGKYYVKIKFKTKYSGTVKKAVKISPKTTSIKSITAAVQGFTVKWNKVTSCTTGYQVQYSTSKSFSSKKTKTITSNTTTSKKITGLTGAKKYYVRVRAYKKVKVNGETKTYYSAWSSKEKFVCAQPISLNATAQEVAQEYDNVKRIVYGVSVQKRALEAYVITGDKKTTKTLYLTFAIHGYEDSYAKDGKVLVAEANKLIQYYAKHPELLGHYRLIIIPCLNPDGTIAGKNNQRACSSAFGRCTAAHVDMNRDFLSGKFKAQESRALRDLMEKYKPTVLIDFHGWLNETLGTGWLVSTFNSTLGLSKNLSGSYGTASGYLLGYVHQKYGVPTALVEFKSPGSVRHNAVVKAVNKVMAHY